MRFRQKVKSPLTSVETLVTERAKIATKNKDRAKAMERKIAKKLKGRRQPGSGSMSPFKGDCFIPLNNHNSSYLIECKSSAAMKNEFQPRIRLNFSWFTKLEKDRTSMECLFGVLIIHYHNQLNDYVFFAKKDIIRLYSWFSAETQLFFEKAFLSAVQIDMLLKQNGDERKGYELLKKQLDAAMLPPIDNIRVAKILLPLGEYIVLRLEDFKDIIAEL